MTDGHLSHTNIDTDRRRAAYLKVVRQKIEEFGWMIQAVFPPPGDDAPPFSYTVGLAGMGHPEIVMVGLDHTVTHGILNGMAERVRGGEKFTPGVYESVLADDYPIWLIECDPIEVDARLRVATAIKGGPVEALQLVWPDADRKFPWDGGLWADDEAMRILQPLLGLAPR